MKIQRLPIQLRGDDRRVIARPFVLNAARAGSVLRRVAELDEGSVDHLLQRVRQDFGTRHRRTDSIFDEHYRMALTLTGGRDDWSLERRLLAGAYFTMEYSIDSAALFNPSIVAHPDQSNVPAGALRFVMSLRATGEGHVSSVVFRTGLITADQQVELDPAPAIFHRARVVPDRKYNKHMFRTKLREIGVQGAPVETVIEKLQDAFTMSDLTNAIDSSRSTLTSVAGSNEMLRTIHWVASSNYHINMSEEANLSELVIFPMSEDESHGIEDLRMVRFIEDDGTASYYGTYTAYNGVRALPTMMHTHNFKWIEVHSLNGPGSANKGMALFPRKIDGKFVVCSRIDGENLFISRSDSAWFWSQATRLATPRHYWELMQIGNCGSPLETEAGWLLLTHGVGPVRSYAIGAVLLDLNDPLKVIGALPEPIITPLDNERDGYVPNVVYTCGAIIHGRSLFVPYAQADKTTSMAVMDLDELLDQLKKHPG
ncbi:MAG TPA: glycoside hydrolase family 130 protein [Tepidisphaeraceae bacterium]|nr:glycoside hydrolase family 130 protein [Tepidisphaeraceae bacterium]